MDWRIHKTQWAALAFKVHKAARKISKIEIPERLNIFWKMSETHEDGLATPEEFAKLEVFENCLCKAVHPDEHSILVMALTCNGEKEFVFYTGDASGFLHRLTNMPQEEERYPITIQRYDDPNWKYFESVTSDYQ